MGKRARDRAERMLGRALYRRLRASGYGVRAAVYSVRRHDSFALRLSADIRAHNKRSKAAKRAWRTRKANAEAAGRD